MLGLKEAAEMAGVAESTVYRAAKKGQISATTGNGERLLFDPAEIDRWASARPGRASANMQRIDTPTADSLDPVRAIARLEAELAAERRRIADLERDRERLERDRDRWADLATGALRQITDQRPAPARSSFWTRVFR